MDKNTPKPNMSRIHSTLQQNITLLSCETTRTCLINLKMIRSLYKIKSFTSRMWYTKKEENCKRAKNIKLISIKDKNVLSQFLNYVNLVLLPFYAILLSSTHIMRNFNECPIIINNDLFEMFELLFLRTSLTAEV